MNCSVMRSFCAVCTCLLYTSGKFCPECGSKKPEPKPAADSYRGNYFFSFYNEDDEEQSAKIFEYAIKDDRLTPVEEYNIDGSNALSIDRNGILYAMDNFDVYCYDLNSSDPEEPGDALDYMGSCYSSKDRDLTVIYWTDSAPVLVQDGEYTELTLEGDNEIGPFCSMSSLNLSGDELLTVGEPDSSGDYYFAAFDLDGNELARSSQPVEMCIRDRGSTVWYLFRRTSAWDDIGFSAIPRRLWGTYRAGDESAKGIRWMTFLPDGSCCMSVEWDGWSGILTGTAEGTQGRTEDGTELHFTLTDMDGRPCEFWAILLNDDGSPSGCSLKYRAGEQLDVYKRQSQGGGKRLCPLLYRPVPLHLLLGAKGAGGCKGTRDSVQCHPHHRERDGTECARTRHNIRVVPGWEVCDPEHPVGQEIFEIGRRNGLNHSGILLIFQ